MAHTLIHWRHNLDGWVVDYLERQNISTKKENKKRKRWSQERKTEHANEVVDMMEEKGEINSLWRDFHLNLKAAREDKVGSAPPVFLGASPIISPNISSSKPIFNVVVSIGVPVVKPFIFFPPSPKDL